MPLLPLKLDKFDLFKIVLPVLTAGAYYLVHMLPMRALLYLVGWYLGMGLLILDKNYFYKFYFESVHLKDDSFARLITRSLLFILAYLVLTLFIVTSSGSNFGSGLVLGIGLILGLEMFRSRTYVEFFNQYFVQANKNWTLPEIDLLVKAFGLFYLVMVFFSVIKL